MRFATLRRLSSVVALWAVSGVLLVLGGTLLSEHISAVRNVRGSALPLVEEIPQLQHRIDVIEEQQELSALSAALRIGSPEERVRVYALPTEVDVDKTVAVLDLLITSLKSDRLLASSSPLEFGTAQQLPGGLMRTPVRMTVALHEEGIGALTTFVRLCGLLTLADAFTPAERTRLLRQTEIENPAAIVALEQYLHTDLLSYLEEPRSAEEQLLRSFSSQSFERAFREVLRTSLLPSAQRVVDLQFARSLREGMLWPMQMMDITALELHAGGAPGWYTAQVEIGLYTQK
jgi:hypothetical protein